MLTTHSEGLSLRVRYGWVPVACLIASGGWWGAMVYATMFCDRGLRAQELQRSFWYQLIGSGCQQASDKVRYGP